MFEIIMSFLKKAAYTAVGSVLAALTLGFANYQPSGSPLDLQVYGALVAFFTGIIAAIKRWMDNHPANPVNALPADEK